MFDLCYRFLTHAGGAPVRFLLRKRLAAGKEDPVRWTERKGKPTLMRPQGPLIWCHAASVGESLSLLALIERLRRLDPCPTILVTTGTLASARLLNERLPHRSAEERARVIHQFVPLDRPRWVNRFLDHWRPDLALWIESELWPNLLAEIHRRAVPIVLLNGRMSRQSHRHWALARGWAKDILAPFALVLAQTEIEAQRFQTLGAWPVACFGNLKCAAAPPPADDAACAALREAIGGRPVWLFASSHPGEEEIALAMHRQLVVRHPGLLTVIVPRHPRRADDIKSLLRSRGKLFATRSAGELPRADHVVYLADTMGELGVFYSVIPVCVVGGSFLPYVGGHSPVEAAQLGSAIIMGPHTQNCSAIVEALTSAGGAIQVTGEAGLADRLDELIGSPARARRQAEAARQVVLRDAVALDHIFALLLPLLRTIGLRSGSSDELPAPTDEDDMAGYAGASGAGLSRAQERSRI